jgi:hypothetical protein
MTVHTLFSNSPFGPEDIAVLVAAYDELLRALGLVQRSDALTDLVASKIISIAQSGLRDPADIAQRAIEEFGLSGAG